MKHAALCFFWHMHQPYYTDPVTRSACMPWVRLHATKAYYDMAFQLDRFPTLAATFNFTPSLLLQVEEIASGAVADVFLEHARKPAADLTAIERAFLVRHFFTANWATMVRPYPRYQDLLVKRGTRVLSGDLERIAQRFSIQELTDLQVWHNLAWFGYGAAARLPQIGALRKKGRGFTEADKREVLTAQISIMKEVVPLYRTLVERGQVELTTTPFYHPIVPLLIDTELARRALPQLPALPRLQAIADAETQIQRAVEFHSRLFGQAPKGLWPSEGSVCPELIPLLHKAGFEWTATDEGILQRSLAMSHQGWDRTGRLYQPYRVGPDGQEVRIVFRDRELSDAFGFSYHKTLAHLAVDDAMGKIRQIVQQAPGDEILIPVILDGENPWEHYHQGGEEFLTLLYQRVSQASVDTFGPHRLTTATLSRAIAAHPLPQRLHELHSGSWINSDFRIWIGHQEDRQAWELLAHTRNRLVEISPTLSEEQGRAAWEELYAAEGSDWFWWYGDEFETDFKLEFDRLFRTHLRNVWLRAGLAPPDHLHRPLVETAPDLLPDAVANPTRLLDPVLDGRATDFFEWHGAGSIRATPPLGAMWAVGRFFTRILFGFSLDRLYLRLDPDASLAKRTDPLTVEWDIGVDGRVYRLAFPLLPPETTTFTLAVGRSGERLVHSGKFQSIARKTIIEVAVPFDVLQLSAGQWFTLSVLVTRQGMEEARYPSHAPVTLQVPTEHFDAMMWRV